MATPKERKDVYIRGVHTDAVEGSKPIKFKSYLIPEYFYCTVYLFDSDGKKVTKANDKNFKVWSVELLIRATAPETLETISTTIKGASANKGQAVVKFINTSLSSVETENLKEFSKLGKVKPSYYKSIADNRARIMGFAITSAVQSFKYKKQKDGSHYWPPFSRVEVPESELQVLAKGAVNNTYIKLDDAFYQEVARLYKKAVADGEWPNEVIKQAYGRDSTKTVQGWTAEAYKRGLISDKDKGKVSTVKKTARKSVPRKKGK
jgi:hypothetical protein